MAGLALDGGGFSYVNPLHVRDDHRDPVERGARRQPWYACACCPPNVMRLLASLRHYLATVDDGGVQIHQYATGRRCGRAVRVRTEYPWDGRVEVEVAGGGRVDSEPARAGVVGGHQAGRHDGAHARGLARRRLRPPHARRGRPATASTLELDDARRGSSSRTRGSTPSAAARRSSAGRWSTASRARTRRGAREWTTCGSIPAASCARCRATTCWAGSWRSRPPARTSPPRDGEWPYGAAPNGDRARPVSLLAVPYSHWGNRGDGGMRVWTPVV